MKKATKFLMVFFTIFNIAKAQSYHGINGSPYAGISNTFLNPASSVNSFYKWDVSLVGVQFATSQNLFHFNNISLTAPPKTFADSMFSITPYTKTRYYHGILDGQALSFRLKLGDKRAVGVSFRGRTYNHLNTSKMVYPTSQPTFQGLLEANLPHRPINVNMVHAGWTEINLNYSQIIEETQYSKLSGGISVAILKSLSGAQAFANDLDYTKNNNPANSRDYYTLKGGSFGYMYSKNIGILDSLSGSSNAFNEFYAQAKSGVSFSFGAEYLMKESYDGEPLNTRNYDWKVGLSIMDFGSNNYDHVNGSASNRIVAANITDTLFERQFSNVASITRVRDSLNSNFLISNRLNSTFGISTPTRLMINVDRNFGNHFYLNASVGINFYTTKASERGNTRELNFFTLTPRYETQLLGAYLPIQYTQMGDFWVGAAVKIGPFIMGIHDLSVLGWGKEKTQTLNSGGYFMFNIYPYRNTNSDGVDCPKKLF